jgi:hypothetical protein
MRRQLECRLVRLEQRDSLALPRHLPIEEWSDEQLMAVIAPGRIDTITDEELTEIAAGDGT